MPRDWPAIATKFHISADPLVAGDYEVIALTHRFQRIPVGTRVFAWACHFSLLGLNRSRAGPLGLFDCFDLLGQCAHLPLDLYSVGTGKCPLEEESS